MSDKLEAFANRPKSAKKEATSLKLPDDFAAKLDEIMKLRAELDELRKHVNQVCRFFFCKKFFLLIKVSSEFIWVGKARFNNGLFRSAFNEIAFIILQIF